MSSSNRVNPSPLCIGVIGTGGMGGRHARNLGLHTPHAAVVAVMDLNEERAQQVATECSGARVYTDADLLIEDPAVEAVVIASPDPTHAYLARACISAGKPVLCEKPLATSVTEAKTVIDAEAAGGRRLVQLGFMREYDQDHLHVKAAACSGKLGKPLYFRSTHVNRDGGGTRTIDDVIINSVIHDIHSARWILGGRVSEVFSRHMPDGDAGPESCRFALLQLTFDGGEVALLEFNPNARYGYEVRIEVMCEHGTISADGIDGVHLRQEHARTQSIEPDWLERFDTAYRQEAKAWVAATRAGCLEGPSAWDGYLSMVIADACIASAYSGRPEQVPMLERPDIYADA